METAEANRLAESRANAKPWKMWGPYLTERQWGTVREDYSPDGNAWDFFSHDQARSRAYQWGEDGLAGISDDKQRLCFALAFWNGQDPILKERLFGLTNSEGNHGEDVKEYYCYLDSTPTHSYMKCLYKYPQDAYPYDDLVHTNRKRSCHEPEYELIDTGIFNKDRYFDVLVEYAKAEPEDIFIRITATNRGHRPAGLHILPTVWFRNTWFQIDQALRPQLRAVERSGNSQIVSISHPELGKMFLYCDGQPELLFTENETNHERLFGRPNSASYVKDGINDRVVNNRQDRVNPDGIGTKCSAWFVTEIPAGQDYVIRLRLTRGAPERFRTEDPMASFEQVFSSRKREADAFYESITPDSLSADQAMVMRQALAGMLWSKQYYCLHLDRWLEQHGIDPMISVPRDTRNADWFHMINDDIISMPDKWEYPWYAAWDLAFHTTALAMVDLDFAKSQLDLMLRELYLHPNGQIPAYEWNFSDVNPPVHAWATLFLYSIDQDRGNDVDIDFLKRTFHKLLLNFTWWVNRKDRTGRNIFEGGFLGLDNIGVFDRSRPLPTGGCLEQADGTSWMALFAQNMFEIAVELSERDSTYEDVAVKFLEHFFWIASAMDRIGEHHDELWDEEDGFFYDLLRFPNGDACRLKVRSLVGLLPLCATTVISEQAVKKFPRIVERARFFLRRHPEVMANIAPPGVPGVAGRRLFAIVNESKLRRILSCMLDEKEFLSQYGIRSLSRRHLDHPYVFHVNGEEFKVSYLPAESDTGMFGGNSNWRGPIWFPMNALLIRALLQFYLYYGNDFRVECPTGSGRQMTLFEVARQIANRLANIFLLDKNGHRPVFGAAPKFQTDPNWRDKILFYEYFHGDNGAGIGASHQTGWTGLVARFLQLFGHLDPQELLESETTRPMTRIFRKAAAAGTHMA
ncbi:MAG TPA: glucosidase [Acidobacteriota bacterium]|nr:glucosidase [Acidobacteriota bacterium]